MHEWALAEAVVETATSEINKAGFTSVKEIKIKVGELAQIEVDSVKFAIENILPEYKTIIIADNFVFEDAEAVLKCRHCSTQWNYRDSLKNLDDEKIESIHFIPEIAHGFLKCPKCMSPDFEIMSGRGLTIESIEGE